jgi:hyperpolarization activated cyclic nucleotide-gated potassium channel 2
LASGEFGSSFGAALQRAGDTEITMPPWVYQKRPEERFDDTLWGDSNTTRRPGRKNRSRQPESDSGKGTGDADDSDDPPAKDEVPLHTRLTKYADAVDSPSMHTMSSKTPEDELAGWYRKRWYSIDPNAGFRGKWDLSQAAILLYVAMVVPFRVGYRQPAEGGWYVVDLLIDIYFYVDVVLNFHTGYVDPDDEERVIYEPWAIAREYARTWLSIDIVACLPIDFVIRVSEGRLLCSMAAGGCPEDVSQQDSSGQLLRLFKLLRLFRLMKLLRLARIARLFERYQDDLFQYLHFFAVLKLVVIMLYVGHLFGCFFHYFSVDEWRTDDELAQIDAGALSPWLKEYFDDAHSSSGDVWDRYIASMYWAFTTMTTVGYGDISSVTRSERIIACFGMLVGGFVFSAVIGTIGDVVAARDLSKKAHAHKMEAVAAFIRDNQLPQEYYKEVLGFFRKQHVVGYDRRALLNDMPYWLRKKILFFSYADVIKKTPLFDVDGDGDAHVFVTELCSRLRPVSYPSGQIIYQRGEIARHMFILTVGKVEVLDKTANTVLTTLAPGAYFGEGCVLGDVRRRENVRALGHVELCQLVSHELDDLLDTYPHLQRLLRAAYFKRKALLDRFETAREADKTLSLRRFMQTEMRGGRRSLDGGGGVETDGPSGSDGADGEDDAARTFDESNAASNASDALGKRKSLRGKLSGDVRLEDVSVADTNQVEVEPGASRDPTLEFDLTAEEKKVEEEATPLLLSRNASAKASTRALELKVEEMEGKLEETLAAVRRVETLMQDLAKT